ncbi:MAG: UDP-galactopyranose mutase [Lentisphaerae bacterium]|nr:UDP-galactopyranose mutase [Lentisphaerota bacterium]
MKKLLVVGCGFYGAVVAERVASQLDLPVTIIDRRNHIGGNSWSEVDPKTGVEYHKYGSHIFHTSNEKVWEYIGNFTGFNEYRHTVLTTYKNEVYTMPINLGSINQYFRKAMSPEDARKFIANEIAKENITDPANLEEKAISLIGRGLYEAFFRGYTIKQWEKDPTELSPDIITRLPVRYNYNHRYFADKFEGIPLDGYGKLFERLVDHKNITVKLNTDFADIKGEVNADTLVLYTGAIDEFFDYSLGALEWRTVDFTAERFDYPDYQGTTVMNYAEETVPFTRIHEFKHYHPERQDTGKTLIFKEFSRFAKAGDEPYYPVFTERNKQLYDQYIAMAAEKAPNVVFGGRLGLYKYLDMDDTVEAALEAFEKIKSRF